MVSLGLMRALRERGLRVAPFKCGPDYIDTQFHTTACCGVPGINLDLFMASTAAVRALYARHLAEADVAVIEGAMGLYDGYRHDTGSAADVARTLGVPVVAVIDGASTAFTAGAVIYGLSHFRQGITLAGVIFNRASSPRHRAMLADAAREAGVECLGFISRRRDLQTPSRHLGLTLTGHSAMERFVAEAAKAVAEGVNIDRLIELTGSARPDASAIRYPAPHSRVAVARDEAFSFIYEANLNSLRLHGVEPVFFSPLRDQNLPPDADMLYLPGGYPELFAADLEANGSMRRSIRDMARRGGRILGECGGLIYLCERIDGAKMCGVLPLTATMEDARLTLGYRTIEIDDRLTLRGHEFHYSRLVNAAGLPSVARQSDALGNAVDTPLYRQDNTIAGYTHLYWGETDINRLWK